MFLHAAAEVLGTALFFTVILSYGESPVAIAVGLLAAIYAFSKVSGGHFNSALSFLMLVKGDINATQFGMYVVAQIIGAMLAYYWWKHTNKRVLRW